MALTQKSLSKKWILKTHSLVIRTIIGCLVFSFLAEPVLAQKYNRQLVHKKTVLKALKHYNKAHKFYHKGLSPEALQIFKKYLNNSDYEFLKNSLLNQPELPQIKIKENFIELSYRRRPKDKMTIKILSEGKIMVAGKAYRLNFRSTLQENYERLSKEMQFKVSFLEELFFPSAYASKPYMKYALWGAILSGLIAWIINSKNNWQGTGIWGGMRGRNRHNRDSSGDYDSSDDGVDDSSYYPSSTPYTPTTPPASGPTDPSSTGANAPSESQEATNGAFETQTNGVPHPQMLKNSSQLVSNQHYQIKNIPVFAEASNELQEALLNSLKGFCSSMNSTTVSVDGNPSPIASSESVSNLLKCFNDDYKIGQFLQQLDLLHTSIDKKALKTLFIQSLNQAQLYALAPLNSNVEDINQPLRNRLSYVKALHKLGIKNKTAYLKKYQTSENPPQTDFEKLSEELMKDPDAFAIENQSGDLVTPQFEEGTSDLKAENFSTSYQLATE